MSGITIEEFTGEVEDVITDATFYRDRQFINDRTRWARWEGQSDDGKKHQKNLGTQPFPFENASDYRVRIVDEVINREVRLLMAAYRRSKKRVKGTESTDYKKAGETMLVLQWMIDTQMGLEAEEEAQMISELRQQSGGCLMRVDWHRERDTEVKTVTEIELTQAAQEAESIEQQEPITSFLATFQDDNLDTESAALLQAIIPEIKDKHAKKAVKDLRENGQAEYPAPYFKINRPRWSARRIYRDVFFPANTINVESARWIADRYYLTETQVRDKELSEGWSKSFINELLEHGGKHSLESWGDERGESKFGLQSSYELAIRDNDKLFEIFYVYSKGSDEDGTPRTYFEPMSVFVKDQTAFKKSEILGFKHGKYPFVRFQRETSERGMVQSRGLGEILMTDQNALKTQLDYGNDRTSLDILPMWFVPPDRAKIPIVGGPNMMIPKMRGDTVTEPIVLPNSMGNAELTMRHIMDRINSYVGLNPDTPEDNLLYKQDLIDKYLSEWKEVLSQTLALMQQYMPDVETSIIINSNEPPLRMTREQIQGKYDISMQFSAQDLDAEQVKAKLAGYKELIALDRDGVIDVSELITELAPWIDPVSAQNIVKPKETVQKSEIEDEQGALAMIFGGIEPEFNPEGKNAQLRLQVIQDSITKNPQLQERYQSDEIYKGMVDARAAGYQQTLVQQENAQIGRTGTEPFLGSDEAQKAASNPQQ